MGLISCPDCEGKVSDIAPSCPRCGRPFEDNVKEPAAATPSQDGFKNSATENVFAIIWGWILLQRKILKFLLILPLASLASFFVLFLPIFAVGKGLFEFSDSSVWILLNVTCVLCGAGISAWECFLKKPK
jgi:hypothetical protein